MSEQFAETAQTAADVLAALRAHHKGAAIVPEVTISDEAGRLLSTRENRMPTTRRIDALMFDSLLRTAIEIKVSAADVKRDTWQKVWPWMRVTHRFVYAVPAGLIDAPPVYGCGLWWVHPSGLVEVKRRAKVSHTPEPLPQQVVQTLAYRACGRQSISPVEVTYPPVSSEREFCSEMCARHDCAGAACMSTPSAGERP